MRQILICLLTLILAWTAEAKRFEKLVQQAGQELWRAGFSDDPDIATRLLTASRAIDSALAKPDAPPSPSAWIIKASVYLKIAYFNPEYQSGDPAKLKAIAEPKQIALEAIRKALTLLDSQIDTALSDEDCRRLTDFCDEFEYPATERFKAEDFYAALDSYRPLISIVVNCKRSGYTGHTFYWYKTALYRAYMSAHSLGLSDEAERYFQLMYQEKAYPEIFLDLHSRTAANGDPVQALLYLNEGMDAFPDHIDLLNTAIDHLSSQNQIGDELITLLEKGAKLQPQNSLYLENMLATLVRLTATATDGDEVRQRYSQGRAVFKRAHDQAPNNANIHLFDGQLRFVFGAWLSSENAKIESSNGASSTDRQQQIDQLSSDAEAALQKSERLDPSNAPCLAMLEAFYRNKGDEARAEIFANRLATIESGGTIEASYFAHPIP